MWGSRVLCALALVCALTEADDVDSRIVHTKQGPIKGYRAPGGELFEFHNVPYATAPTGKDRFKAPLPAPVWMTPFEAVDRGIICPQETLGSQSSLTFPNKTMKEDCLIANIYVPDTNEKKLPVVFYVHGGAYQMGFGDMFTPRHLVRSKKIIFVNFNYRLGVHGFLCLGTPDVPGNAGMKDQVAALRWVHRNIASFGGNPNDITIHGSSAGSSAVDLLLLSKTTKGLFHRAIPESGGNVGTWSVQIDPIANAKEFAKSQNFEDVGDIYALEQFYKTVPFEILTKGAFARFQRTDNDFEFSPCIERDTGVERFLDDYPVNILKKGDYNKVPMLYGFSKMEGLFRISAYEPFKHGMNAKFSNYLPRDLHFKTGEEKEKVATDIKKFYFGNKDVGGDTIMSYIDYFTDILFAYPMMRSLKLQVEAGNNNIYLYQFSFPLGEPLKVEGVEPLVGANHCAQTFTLLDGIFLEGIVEETNIPEDIKKVKNLTREFWLNFMTTGAPVPQGSELPAWPPANALGSPYMDITEHPQLGEELLSLRMRFWDDIYARYYRAPVPPSTPPPKHTEL